LKRTIPGIQFRQTIANTGESLPFSKINLFDTQRAFMLKKQVVVVVGPSSPLRDLISLSGTPDKWLKAAGQL
jgi:hypothetical protein